MTDHDLDALASDLLDGLLPAERAADALRDPAVAQRVSEMRAAQALVRETPAVDRTRREAGLAAALATAATPSPGADTPGAPDTPHSPDTAGTPDELAARRSGARPARRPRRHVPGWLTAAAVLLLVVAFGGLVATVGTSDSDNASTSSDAAAPPTEESADDDVSAAETESDAGAGESSGAPAPGAPTTTAPTLGTEDRQPDASPDGPVDLGEVSSVDEIAVSVDDAALAAARRTDEVADELPQEQLADGGELAPFAACRPAGTEETPGRIATAAAVALLDGRPVTAWVVAEDGARTLIVADAGCTVVGRRALPG